MKIGFIGAGKVGTAFGLFLKDRGVQLCGYASRSYASACTAAELTSSRAYLNALELIQASDIIFLTTSDDQIEKLAASLAEQLGKVKPSTGASSEPQIFVHMSGAHSAEILLPLKEMGYEIGTLHPLQSVSDIEQARLSLGGVLFSMEAHEKSRLEGWIQTLGIEYVRVASENKVLYHTAAVFASNYVVTVIDTAIRLFETCGFTEEEARRGLMPLIYGSVANVERFGAENALTGPIPRGDRDTIARHLEQLQNFPEIDHLYRVLAASALSLAQRSKLKNPGQAAAIKALISEGGTICER